MSAHIYKNAQFKKFAKKNGISDKDLLNAVEEIEKGLIDAELGGGVIKKRIAGRGKGKSGGFRTILLFKEGKRIIFAHGFSKGKKANITHEEQDGFKEVARVLLGLKNAAFQELVDAGEYVEIKR